MSDAQVVADHAELQARWMTAWFGCPMLPDEYWADFTAELTPVIAEELAMLSNACAVMADVSQPIGSES